MSSICCAYYAYCIHCVCCICCILSSNQTSLLLKWIDDIRYSRSNDRASSKALCHGRTCWPRGETCPPKGTTFSSKICLIKYSWLGPPHKLVCFSWLKSEVNRTIHLCRSSLSYCVSYWRNSVDSEPSTTIRHGHETCRSSSREKVDWHDFRNKILPPW